MHRSYRALLKQNGARKLAEKISGINYPVRRPNAAFSDPKDNQIGPKAPLSAIWRAITRTQIVFAPRSSHVAYSSNTRGTKATRPEAVPRSKR